MMGPTVEDAQRAIRALTQMRNRVYKLHEFVPARNSRKESELNLLAIAPIRNAIIKRHSALNNAIHKLENKIATLPLRQEKESA